VRASFMLQEKLAKATVWTKEDTMVKRLAVLIVGLSAVLPAAEAAPPAGPFLCIVDQTTGFAFSRQSKSWHSASFAAGQKLILKRTDKSLHEAMPGVSIPVSGAWAVWDFGDDHWPHYTCQTDFSQFGVLWCESPVGERFSFNVSNHRFISDSLVGYVQVGMPGNVGVDGKQLPEGSNTPYIAIGTCTAL